MGKVGYFQDPQEACDFGYNEIMKHSDDDIIRELRSSVEDIERDFLNLKKFNTKRLFRKHFIFKNHVGIRVANYFMGFRLKLRAYKKRPPIEGLRIKKMFDYCAKTHYIMQRSNDISTIKDIFDRMRIRGGTQELNNFPPVVAKTLYEHYCDIDGAKILDISSGFAGRLTGAMASRNNYEYCGVDPQLEAVHQTRELIKFLNCEARAKIIEKPFEDADEDLPDEYFDYCFTSPPYFNKEIYSDDEKQYYNRFPEIGLWRVGFLKKSFEIVLKKLKPGCLMMINIADVKLGNDIINLGVMAVETAKEVGFEYEGFDKMLIGNRFSSMKKSRRVRKSYNFEPIFKFRKKN